MAAVSFASRPSPQSEAAPASLDQHTVSALTDSAPGLCRTNGSGNSAISSATRQPFPSRCDSPPMDMAPTFATRQVTRLPKAAVAQRAVLPYHVRARSETLACAEPTGRLLHTKSRVRAASTAEPPCSSRRPVRLRLASLLSTRSPAPAILHAPHDEAETLGSFAPTNPSGLFLRSLLRPKPLALDITRISRHCGPDPLYDEGSVHEFSDDDSPHSPSPPDSPAIPSICRTPSSYTGSDYFPTAPSSAGPATPARELSPSPIHRQKQRPLQPVLESLEDQSRFCVKTACANCHKTGNNFPCCPRCGEMWCSRECRVQSNRGKRHLCKKN
ncbi:hypothetical protein DAEQUDRAFT_702712 [Daedalea quercina L-15889]|uniref:Uncharacterized protein n=1 Tax=Daedalea quercina L-15889 TaxID=1314783 RepID=A0A165TQJ1_9APHY|nr:hypothetical protein DAEQUDRAFT_702712 [Daedalea quercina L-15889]